MTIFYQLYGMLKSSYINMKRNKCLSFIELFTPFLLILFFFVLSSFFDLEEQKYNDDDIPFLFNYSSNFTNKISSPSQIISDINDINNSTPIQYKKFLAQCQNYPHVALIGKKFPEKLKNKISQHFWEFPDDINIDIKNFFKTFDTIDEFNNYIRSKNYGTDEINYPKMCFGISKDDKKQYGFSIHYDTYDAATEQYFLFDAPKIPDSKTSKYEKIKTQTDLKAFETYQNSGYLMVMKLIYDYILQEVTGILDAEINFCLVEMIYDSILKDKFHKYIYLLGFFIIISYAIILSINIYREINFRETKKKEYIKSMGIKEKIFFLSSFIRSFIINIIHSVMTSLIIKFLLLKQSQFIYLFLILFLYGLVIFSMTFFFQTFQQKSRKGVIMSLLCYCIMCFLYLPINSPIIDNNIINLFCILFPPVNLMLGLDVLFTYEKEFHQFDNIKKDIGRITILEMLIFFILNFIIYLIIGYIISKCFHYEYGIRACSKKRKINNSLHVPVQEKERNVEIKKEKENEKEIDINKNNIEQSNNDDIISSFSQKKPYNNKELKIIAQDIISTPMDLPTYKSKIEGFSSRMILDKTENKNHLFNIINETDEYKNKIYIDELEKDVKMQRERQIIRKKRRDLGKTISNLKEEEYFVNNFDVSVMQDILRNEFKSTKEIDNIISETASSNTEILEKGEFNKIKDDINPGQRLEVIKLEKYYINEHKKVLENLDCTMYENEIFALLGENGAGKSTFISIIGGLIEATGGSIMYKKNIDDKGYDILDRKGNYQFRKILGICPQNNSILFNDLTVEENLEIFCILKYRNDKNYSVKETYKEIKKEVQYLLDKFYLNDKKKCLAKDLSGGQKRKLCIAIACCGKRKIIILDEPTGGVDLLSKKSIWSILKKLKEEEKIIILISHSMEEVSFLADKIGILKDGKLACQGTSRELIDNYGKYFSLIINQKLSYDTAKNVSDYIYKDYYNKEKMNIKKDELSTFNSDISKTNIIDKNIKFEVFREKVVIKIAKDYFQKEKSSQLFEELKNNYKIQNYLIIEDQLEDVFINVINNNNNDLNLYKSDYNVFLNSQENKKDFKGFKKFIDELKVLFFKKNFQDFKTIILEILFPVILILIACLVSYIEFLEENKSNDILLINLNDDSFQNVYYENLTNIDEDDNYIIQNIINEEKRKNTLNNYNFSFVNITNKNTSDLTQTEIILYYMKIININKKNGTLTNNNANFLLTEFNNIDHKYEFISFMDTKRKHHPIFFTNYLLNCIIKYVAKKTNEYNYSFNYERFVNELPIVNSPFPLNYKEKHIKKSRNGFSLVFFTSIAFSLIPSNIITSIIKEKENKLKHLQILSELSLFTYWLNNYIFELLKYIFISTFSYLILIAFNFEDKYLIILYILYGPAMLSFTYFMSYFITSEGSGQTMALLINLLFGTLGSSAILILRTNEDAKNLGKILSYFFRFIPSFCMSYGYNELISKDLLFTIDNHIDEINKNSNYILNYIKDDIIFLAIEIVVYTGILIILEQKDYLIWRFFRKCRKKNINHVEIQENKKDNKYYLEKKNIKDDYSKVRMSNYQPKETLLTANIKKIFQYRENIFKLCKKQTKVVLNNVSFKIENGECFGLIGTNGAGKTTCFRCLCKEIKPDGGFITINDLDIFDYSNPNPSIGYCPQFDAIFESLTVEQNIYFFFELKKYKGGNLKTLTDALIKCLDLEKFRNVRCKNLSGGNKRKLSVGISILSSPDIILLDEPSTGMDPFSRRLLLNLLNYGYLKDKENGKDEKRKKGIILTSHSLEEIEALCDKVGILINGKMEDNRIGSINKIINNNKKGIILNLEFQKPLQNDIIKNYEKTCEETLNNKEEIITFLQDINKKDYVDYINEKSLGRDLLALLQHNKSKSISKYTVMVWVKYMDYLKNLVGKIKNIFVNGFIEVVCKDIKLNNFILHIKNDDEDTSESYIFCCLESNKEDLKIEEYSYTLTTFENIFLEFCKEAYQNNEIIEEPYNLQNESETGIEVIL